MSLGFPGGSVLKKKKTKKKLASQCRRHGFNPWVGKIPEKEMITHSSSFAWGIP